MSKNPKPRLYVESILDEIRSQGAHGSYMLPWPGIQCNFEVDPEHVDTELNVADVQPMAEKLLTFLESGEQLMAFNAPYMPGVNYLTRWGAQHVWAVMPGWGKVRPRPRSEEVELLHALSGRPIDPGTGLPIVVKKSSRN